MVKTEKIIIEFITAFIIFTGLILLIRLTDLDLSVSDKVFSLNAFKTNKTLEVMARTGKYLSVVFGGALVIILPYLIKKNSHRVKEVMLTLFILVLGPGLLNNFVCKPFFKRARPLQIERFDSSSKNKFIPALSRGSKKEWSSFPSGHAAAAFFFIFPWFWLPLRTKYGWRLFIPGFIFGVSVGSVRILQGQHFLSDIVASLALVYLTGLVLALIFYRKTAESGAPAIFKENQST